MIPDEVHLFVSAIPEISLTKIVQVIKSITTRAMFKRFPSIKRLIWGCALWERGYFAISSGKSTIDEMKRKYIKDQRFETEVDD